jgi:hypothetical protein
VRHRSELRRHRKTSRDRGAQLDVVEVGPEAFECPHCEGMQETVPAGLDLVGAVDTIARHYRRLRDDPDALRHLSFEISRRTWRYENPSYGRSSPKPSGRTRNDRSRNRSR